MTTSLRRLSSLPTHATPEIDVDGHALRVGGRVGCPCDYRLADLRELAGSIHVEDFDCLEGWVVPDQHWEGAPLRVLIDRAGPAPEATSISIGSGVFNIVLPIEDARRAILALSLNGEALSVEHGGPARLVLPGGECYTSIKWVDRITVCSPDDDVRGTARDVAMRRIGLDPGA